MSNTTTIAFFPTSSSPTQALHSTIPILKSQRSTPFVLGPQIQSPSIIQGTFSTSSPSLLQSLTPALGAPTLQFTASLNRPAFGPAGPATAPVVEYVLSYFPVSVCTPAFIAQLEADFARFDEHLFSTPVPGNTGPLAKGWVNEELEHEEIKGEKARGFFVINGWETLADFENLLKTEAFGEAIPILHKWGAPAKLWHVERKVHEDSETVA